MDLKCYEQKFKGRNNGYFLLLSQVINTKANFFYLQYLHILNKSNLQKHNKMKSIIMVILYF